MTIAFSITTDGKVVALPANSFDAIRQAINGYVEPIVCKNVVLWADEDGRLLKLPENAVATALWWHLQPQAKGQTLVGTVVVTGPNGDIIGPVPANIAKMLESWQ